MAIRSLTGEEPLSKEHALKPQLLENGRHAENLRYWTCASKEAKHSAIFYLVIASLMFCHYKIVYYPGTYETAYDVIVQLMLFFEFALSMWFYLLTVGYIVSYVRSVRAKSETSPDEQASFASHYVHSCFDFEKMRNTSKSPKSPMKILQMAADMPVRTPIQNSTSEMFGVTSSEMDSFLHSSSPHFRSCANFSQVFSHECNPRNELAGSHYDLLLGVEEENKRTARFQAQIFQSLQSTTPHKRDDASFLKNVLHSRLPHPIMLESDNGEKILKLLNITHGQVYDWCEYMRKWIRPTVLRPLVQGIDLINEDFRKRGLSHLQVGVAKLESLHDIAQQSPYMADFQTLLPFLYVDLDQKYVVRRIRDLEQGGAMGIFQWNGGGSYDGIEWDNALPTDSALIMHFVCCYFDKVLPSDAFYPLNKVFSNKYFKKSPEKVVKSPNTICIYQSSSIPPHFKIILGEATYDVKKGYNNMFSALALFFYSMKIYMGGRIGHINLGPSGLNIAWIFDV